MNARLRIPLADDRVNDCGQYAREAFAIHEGGCRSHPPQRTAGDLLKQDPPSALEEQRLDWLSNQVLVLESAWRVLNCRTVLQWFAGRAVGRRTELDDDLAGCDSVARQSGHGNLRSGAAASQPALERQIDLLPFLPPSDPGSDLFRER